MNISQPVTILMYHSIGTSQSDAFRPFTVTPDLFEAHLQVLADLGYRSRTVRDLVTDARTTAAGDDGRPAVVLTFDDGFLDFATEALPRLQDRGFTATMYVPTAYVGATSAWLRREGEHERPVMGWDELAAAVAAGIECGAHSHTHPQLDRIRRSAVRDELRRSRHILEDRLEVPVSTFAYPFGYYRRSVVEEVRRAGYEAACAVRNLPVPSLTERHALPRLTVTDQTGPEELRALLDRRPSRLADLGSSGRALASRGMRRAHLIRRGS